MATGIGASLVSITDGTTAHAGDVLSSLNSINAAGVSNDGGAITTDGNGNVGMTTINLTGGKLKSTNSGTTYNAIDASGLDVYVNAGTSGNSVHFQGQTITGKVNGVSYFECNQTFMDILGQYRTHGSNSSIATGQNFDSFDCAEVYPCKQYYPSGTIVCPGEEDHLVQCTHENCPCAMVVSLNAGMILGGVQEDYERGILPIALNGRVNVLCSDIITPRQFVCSDGKGSVRGMKRGEMGFALGFALNTSKDGRVGIVFRPMWCAAN